MLKVMKTPHTEVDELVDLFETDLYKNFKKNSKPGDYVRIYRENLGFNQADMGEKLGVGRAYICDIEKHRRSVGKDMAKQLAKLFDAPVEFFL